MRFMMIVKANQDSEAGKMPSEELLAAMGKRMESGEVEQNACLQQLLDGPFAETKELIAGYWLIQVKSKQEAIDWALRIPCPADAPPDGYVERSRCVCHPRTGRERLLLKMDKIDIEGLKRAASSGAVGASS